MARTYTDEEKADAVALYREHGLAEAHHLTGIPKSTLRLWLTNDGGDPAEIAARTASKTLAATEVYLAGIDAGRARLAAGLLEDIDLLREELFAPCVERKAMVVSQGKEMGSHVEVVRIERDQPTFSEQARIMTTIAIAVDKVQILTGQATERIDVTGDVRARARELADELAARRERKQQTA